MIRTQKSDMIADMIALLRLQDRFPLQSAAVGISQEGLHNPLAAAAIGGVGDDDAATAAGGGSGYDISTAGNSASPRVDATSKTPAAATAPAGSDGGSSTHSSSADDGPEATLPSPSPWWCSVQYTVSQQYLSLPEKAGVLAAVREAAGKICAAVAAAPDRAAVAQVVEQVVKRWEEDEEGHNAVVEFADGSECFDVNTRSNSSESVTGGSGSSRGSDQGNDSSSRRSSSSRSSSGGNGSRLLRTHHQQLVQLEAELQSSGKWQLLNGYFPQQNRGTKEPLLEAIDGLAWSDEDEAAHLYLQLRDQLAQ